MLFVTAYTLTAAVIAEQRGRAAESAFAGVNVKTVARPGRSKTSLSSKRPAIFFPPIIDTKTCGAAASVVSFTAIDAARFSVFATHVTTALIFGSRRAALAAIVVGKYTARAGGDNDELLVRMASLHSTERKQSALEAHGVGC